MDTNIFLLGALSSNLWLSNHLFYEQNNIDKTKLDKYYGIQCDEDGNLWMGTIEVVVDENSNIIVGDVNYQNVSGLWSLIMLAVPDPNNYTKEDLSMFEELIKQPTWWNILEM